jgi:hypothetical protein
MSGDGRARFCARCQKHVHNLSEVTPREALDLVLRSGGRLCLRIERDPRGVPRTRELAEPLYQIGQQIGRRASRLAAGAFGAALTLCSATAARAQTAAPEPAQQVITSPAEVKPEAGTAQGIVVTVQTPENIEEPKETGGMVLIAPSEPLVQAATDNDLEAVKRLLLFEGADVNVVDEHYGTTALTHAFMNSNREMMRELLWRGARINMRLAYRQTALMKLREDTSADAVRDLLDAGAKVNIRDENGDTALMSAARQGRADVVELLLSAGARVNVRNKEGRTALINAARGRSAEAVRLLLQAGADHSLRDAEGHTALWHARDTESDEATALLLSYGAYEEQ